MLSKSHKSERTYLLWLLLIILAFVLAACGGSEDDSR